MDIVALIADMSASDPSDGLSPEDELTEVTGIGPSRADTLRENSYQTVEDLQLADTSDLAQLLPGNVASDVKEQVGNKIQNVPNIAQAKKQAQETPGAKAKTVKVDGQQRTKVLEKEQEQHLPGCTVEIRKG